MELTSLSYRYFFNPSLPPYTLKPHSQTQRKSSRLRLRRPPPKPTTPPTASDMCPIDGLNRTIPVEVHTLLGYKVQETKAEECNKQKTHLPIRRPTTRRRSREKPTPITTIPDVLHLMQGLNITIPVDLYASLIRECTAAKDPVVAAELCQHIIRSGVRPGLTFVNRVLVMLLSCGLLDDARQVFDRMRVRDSNSWATMIAGYMDSANYEEVINIFIKMDYMEQLENDYAPKIPFSWIVVCVLKACVDTKNFKLGKQVHALLMKIGYDEDLYLSSSLMDFYGNFGCLEGLDCVFNHLGSRNTTIWTNKLVNNCRERRFEEAINVFREMGREGVKKNEFTLSSVLRACGRVQDYGFCGRQVHANSIKLGLESNDFVRCGLVDMYAKCGLIENAKMVFETIGGEITVACWNAMLTGYIQHGYSVDAIKVLYAMKSVGLHPQESLVDKVKFTCWSN